MPYVATLKKWASQGFEPKPGVSPYAMKIDGTKLYRRKEVTAKGDTQVTNYEIEEDLDALTNPEFGYMDE
jgi:hypothetical protein